jgi:type II secretory pathway component PulK
MIRERKKLARQRRGVVLFAVIVVITVAAIFFGSWLKTTMSERLVIRSQQYALQSSVLAHSAIERASARLRSDADYAGETWRVPASALDGRHDAVVEIKVEQATPDASQRRVRVQADYPAEPARRVRNTLEINIAIAQERNDP